MKRFFFITLFSLLFSLTAFAQKPTPTPAGENTDEVIRISSKLVLVDALVLDKKGQQVTDLTAEDFELLQDGKPQEITSFGYVGAAGTFAAAQSPKNKKDKKALPLPPVSVRSNKGRIITFVIDDGNCLATSIGLSNARDGMRKFIDNQMLPDDKVAIYRTRSGSSLLQMYTSNKEALKRVVNKISILPAGLSCGSSFEPARVETVRQTPSNSTVDPNQLNRENEAALNNEARRRHFASIFGVLNFVIERLKNLPQRKLVFFISEGIPIPLGAELDGLREVTDTATRASVTFYTLSEKGVTVPGMIEAADDVLPGDTDALRENRIAEERDLNDGLAFLANSTGGKFIRNRNFLEKPIGEILNLETGYYLLGYQPDGETFKGKEFHKIEVKLKREGLRIASRKGFYGREDAVSRPKYKTENSPMYQAISSPFQENGMDIRMTTMVEAGAADGGVIRALFHVKGSDMNFTDEAGGVKKTVLDVVFVLLDEKGKLVEEYNRTYPIRVPAQGVPVILQNGLDYSTDIPVKKSGFYTLRLAVRDANSKRLGSAGDYVEVPNFKKDKFFMNGLLTTDVTTEGKPFMPKTRPAETAFAPVYVNSIPAIRQYHAGTTLAYIYNIYNAKTDAATGKPKLVKQVRLYKNGALVGDTGEKPLEIQPQTDISRISDHGFLRLSATMEAGEYILQVIIRDTLADKTTSQWIDFEVVK